MLHLGAAHLQRSGHPIELARESKQRPIAVRTHAIDDAVDAAIEAQGRVGIMLNVMRSDLERVLALLPALQRPTISSLSDQDWVAVNTVIEERTVRDLIPKLKSVGAQGIVEYPLNKIVL